ncbi:uncharacterized protein LOC111087591 [Limulus polyphemus]|uniref:Uncharacterized protein LOC111087591 n=1 Tax=Limulus polyphemus TaxID=6850 RepID=A0ABM1T3J7_LIMPO|nr:uncharacterized protein LOC111087591 [Limulus polyphemus]
MNGNNRQANVPLAMPGNGAHNPQPVAGSPGPITFNGREPWMRGHLPGPPPPYPMMSGPSEYSFVDPARSSSYPQRIGAPPPPHSFIQPSSQLDPHGQNVFTKYATSSSGYVTSQFQTNVPLTSTIAYHSPGPPYHNAFQKINPESMRPISASENTVPVTSQEMVVEGLRARLFDKNSNPISANTSDASSPGPASSDGIGNVGYRPWEQGSGQGQQQSESSQESHQESLRIPLSSLAQQEDTSLPASRESDDSASQDRFRQGTNEKLTSHSREQTGPSSRPSSRFSSSPGLDSRSQQDSWSQNEKIQEAIERANSYQSHSHAQPMGSSGLGVCANSPQASMTFPHFGNSNTLRYPSPQSYIHHPGHQQQMFQHGANSVIPSPKHMKIEPDSSTPDSRGIVENSFQVPSVSSTTPRQVLPPISGQAEQWETTNTASLPSQIPAIPEATEKPKKKRKRCGECPGCLKKDNCGECGPCKSVRSHQICKMRKCDQLKTKKERASGVTSVSMMKESPKAVQPAVEGMGRNVNGVSPLVFSGQQGREQQLSPLGMPRMQPYLAPNYNMEVGQNLPPPQGENHVFELGSQYGSFHQNPPRLLAPYNGHMPPAEMGDGNPLSAPSVTKEGMNGSGRHRFMNNRLKSLIQSRQNQKEQAIPNSGCTEPYQQGSSGNPSDQLYSDNQSMSPSPANNQNFPGGHASYMVSPAIMSQPLPPISDAMRPYVHAGGGMSPLWQTDMPTRADGNTQLSRNGPPNELSFSRDTNRDNPECAPKDSQPAGYQGTVSNQPHPLNGMSYNAYYNEEAIQQEGETNKPQHQHSVHPGGLAPKQCSPSTYPPSSVEPHSHQFTQPSIHVSSYKGQTANSDGMFSHQVSTSSLAEVRPVSESPSSNHQGETLSPASGNNMTTAGGTGGTSATEETMESQPFLSNTTTSMNTYTNIINTFNFTSPAPFFSPFYSLFSPAFGVTTSTPTVITEADSLSSSFPSKMQESNSVMSVTRGGLVMSDIDSGRIDGSYGHNLYSSNIDGLPSSLTFSKDMAYTIVNHPILIDPTPLT